MSVFENEQLNYNEKLEANNPKFVCFYIVTILSFFLHAYPDAIKMHKFWLLKFIIYKKHTTILNIAAPFYTDVFSLTMNIASANLNLMKLTQTLFNLMNYLHCLELVNWLKWFHLNSYLKDQRTTTLKAFYTNVLAPLSQL